MHLNTILLLRDSTGMQTFVGEIVAYSLLRSAPASFKNISWIPLWQFSTLTY
jgi:hypothetical protein